MSTRKFITSFFILIALSANGYCASFAGSYIKTEAAAVTRNADVLSGSTAGNVSEDEFTLSYNLQYGSPSGLPYNGDVNIVGFGTFNHNAYASFGGFNTNIIGMLANFGSTWNVMGGWYSVPDNNQHKYVFTMLPDKQSFKFVHDGGSPNTDLNSAVAKSENWYGSNMTIANSGGSVSPSANLHIKNLRIWSRSFGDDELVRITQ